MLNNVIPNPPNKREGVRGLRLFQHIRNSMMYEQMTIF